MRKLLLPLVVLFLFQSCISKKKTTYSKKDSNKVAETSTKNKSHGEKTEAFKKAATFAIIRTTSVEEYLNVYGVIAQEEMKKYGIPASITLAQGILESGYGMGKLTMKTNNHFGIKCHTSWDGDFERHDDDEKDECFRKYNHPKESFRDHSIFLSSRSRYASLFELRRDDYKAWAKGLKKAGYATDTKYPQKLISFIERYNLQQYDKAVIKGGLVVRPEPKKYDYRSHVVKKGDTLYSISRTYFMSVDEIKKLNNINSSDLAIGQKLKIKSERLK
ncbi:glucosaminidase domain-containing protein [Eudoraea sp.]|uniref:glucosaminidase domain-containing protein n=2 Tax=Eudoraea sp. TaxID=1979955 RepID=UPI003C762F18